MTGQPILNGWKAIAAHFGRDERTVMRWAETRGLPVRRVPGGGRSSVFALVDDLDEWLGARERQAEPDVSPAEAQVEMVPFRSRLSGVPAAVAIALIGVLALVVATALGVFGHATATAAPALEEVRAPAAEQHFLQASYDLNLRTPESLHRAVDEFGAAIAADPSAAPAYSGLGETYLLLREYTDFPDGQAFARAQAAARAAASLQPRLASAHRVLGFVAFWHDRDLRRARAEFGQAIALAPQDALTRHWYATALAGNAEYAPALAQIGEARRIDPQSTALLADDGLIVYLSGRHDEGLRMLRDVAHDQPEQISAHDYLADLALGEGRADEYLKETAIAASLRHDPALAAAAKDEAAAAQRGGMPALIGALIRRKTAEIARTHDDYYGLARLEALSGDDAAAIRLFRSALTHGEARAAASPSDLMLHRLHDRGALSGLEAKGSLAP